MFTLVERSIAVLAIHRHIGKAVKGGRWDEVGRKVWCGVGTRRSKGDHGRRPHDNLKMWRNPEFSAAFSRRMDLTVILHTNSMLYFVEMAITSMSGPATVPLDLAHKCSVTLDGGFDVVRFLFYFHFMRRDLLATHLRRAKQSVIPDCGNGHERQGKFRD